MKEIEESQGLGHRLLRFDIWPRDLRVWKAMPRMPCRPRLYELAITLTDGHQWAAGAMRN